MIACVNEKLDFSNYKGLTEGENAKVIPMGITHFQLVENTFLSSKDLDLLPSYLKARINHLFTKVVLKKQLQKEIKEKDVFNVSIGTINGKLAYRLTADGYKTLQDKKLQKEFSKCSRKIKKYLKNIDRIKIEKKISKADESIISSSPLTIDKVSKTFLKSLKKSDSEWSLWAIFAMEIRNAISKFCDMFNISWKSTASLFPLWTEDILETCF